MATQNQINANRLNAQKSTGPRTQAGKAVSRLNAIKSGIDSNTDVIFEEERADHAALAAEFEREFQPLGIVERCLLDMIIHEQWLLRRYRMVHANLHSYASQRAWENKRGGELGAGYAEQNNSFHRLHRHYHDTDRAYERHLAELECRQAGRKQHEDEVYSPVTDSPQTENPEIGFVSQPSRTPTVREGLPEPDPQPSELPSQAPTVSEGLPAVTVNPDGEPNPQAGVPAPTTAVEAPKAQSLSPAKSESRSPRINTIHKSVPPASKRLY